MIMPRSLLILTILLATTATAFADFPEGVIEEKQHDFGTVPRGQGLVHYFRVVNPTKGPISITGVRVSCGCVTARAMDSVIPAGGESAIYAHMNSRQFSGFKTVTIFVHLGSPHFHELRMDVRAIARDDLFFSGDAIVLGKVKQGDAKSGTMTITINNGQTQITEAKADSNYVQPMLKEIRRTATESTYEVQAKVRPDTPVGIWFTDVWVKTTGPGLEKLRVPVTVEVEGIQPAKIEPKAKEKKVEATKTSRVSADTESDEPPVADSYHVFAPMVEPVAQRQPLFPFLSLFRR